MTKTKTEKETELENVKEETKKETTSTFNTEEALKDVNRFLKDGFRDYITDKTIKNQNQFNKLLKEYGEIRWPHKTNLKLL